jgi:putative membrane protein
VRNIPRLTLEDRLQRRVWVLSVYALVRTALSSERSLMAWMRTAVTLYTFGFTITKFADYLAAQGSAAASPTGPARLAAILILLGIFGLTLGVVDHLRRMRRMYQLGLPRISAVSLPVASSLALLITGAAALVWVAPGVI